MSIFTGRFCWSVKKIRTLAINIVKVKSKNAIKLTKVQGRIPKNSERGDRGTRQLYRYYLFYWKFFKNNTKFLKKDGGNMVASAKS